jgi:hypothetical protein
VWVSQKRENFVSGTVPYCSGDGFTCASNFSSSVTSTGFVV